MSSSFHYFTTISSEGVLNASDSNDGIDRTTSEIRCGRRMWVGREKDVLDRAGQGSGANPGTT